MNIVANAHKFFIFGGILLLAIAAIQLLSRPRGKAASRPRNPLDPAMIRVGLFVVMGLLALLAGAGVIPMPGDK